MPRNFGFQSRDENRMPVWPFVVFGLVVAEKSPFN